VKDHSAILRPVW